MKKVSLILGGLVFGVSLNAASIPIFNFHRTYDKSKTFGFQWKNVDIKNIGIKSGNVYGLIFNGRSELGEEGYWGLKFTNELDYGKLDSKDSDDKITYTDYLIGMGPSYTFSKLPLEIFLTGKIGYIDLDNTEGYFYGWSLGAEYRPFERLTLGIWINSGTYFSESAQDYDMNFFGGYVGYNF